MYENILYDDVDIFGKSRRRRQVRERERERENSRVATVYRIIHYSDTVIHDDTEQYDTDTTV